MVRLVWGSIPLQRIERGEVKTVIAPGRKAVMGGDANPLNRLATMLACPVKTPILRSQL